MLRLLPIFLLATIAVSAPVALGAPADVDRGFGRDGRVLIDFGGEDYAFDVAAQPDGKLVIAGGTSLESDAVVARVNPDGSPDPGFGAGGVAAIESTASESGQAVAIQPDGKIVVGGGTDAGDDAVVWRLIDDGSRDRGFGDEGELIIASAGFMHVMGIALQPDAKIALAGFKLGKSPDALIYRLLGDSVPPQQPSGGGGGGGPAKAIRCAGLKATIAGTARRDVIRGTRRRDVIAALGGNDVVRGLGGDDVICGGGGRDRLLGGAGRDRLIGGPGRDRVIGGPGRDRTR